MGVSNVPAARPFSVIVPVVADQRDQGGTEERSGSIQSARIPRAAEQLGGGPGVREGML
jgi:hypothetical protein